MNSSMERIMAARAQLTGVATQVQKVAANTQNVQAYKVTEEVVAAQKDTGFADNTLYKIMNDAAKSNEQKIKEIAKYLTAEDENYDVARKRFAEFESYFNYVQGEGMKLDMKGIERLIDEIKNALKPEIEKIVANVVEVQKGVDESKKLLEVLRAARLEGKTIDQISDAIKVNDRLLNEMNNLSQQIRNYEDVQKRRQEVLDAQLDRKGASEQGFANKVVRTLFGPDKNISEAIDLAQQRLNEAKASIEHSQQELAEKGTQRNTNLESGPLTILRSMDATERSFSDNIVSTAESSLKLIEEAMHSIQVLLKRTAYSEATAREINQNIAEAEVRETVLKGAIQQVSNRTRDQSTAIKERLDAKDAEIADTSPGEVQHAVLKAERVDVEQRHNGSLDYQEVLNRTVTNFEVISAGSVEAKSRANQLAALIETEKELLKRLSTEALPATTLALRTVLETDVAQQNSELAMTIGAITEKARATGKDGLQILMRQQGELHGQKLQDMDRAIEALAAAEEAVVGRIETTVKEGVDTRERMRSIVQASAGLQQVLAELNEIRPTVAARNLDETVGGPARPAEARVAGMKNSGPK